MACLFIFKIVSNKKYSSKREEVWIIYSMFFRSPDLLKAGYIPQK